MTRVPEFLMYNQSQNSMSRVRDKLITNQEQGISGKRVNRTSDDPVSAMRAIGLRTQFQRDDQVSQNMELAVSIANITDASLGELGDIIVRAKELAVQMSSSSNTTEDARSAVANEIDQLRLRAVQVGNARLGDRYVFGGYTTDRPPFDEHGNYFGDDGVAQLEIDRGQRLSLNLPGLMPFFGMHTLPQGAAADPQDGGPKSVGNPSVPGTVRSPASFVAEQNGVIQDPKNPQFQEIQRSTGANVFYVLQNFADSLRSGDLHGVQNSIDGLDTGFRQVLQSRAMMGARQNALKLSQESIEGAKESDQTMLSSAEDADVIKVYSDMTKNQNSLQAALEMNKKILTPSLIEFLK
ncbi:MAG: flagellar hook-associated protein FlgL [Bdellovibrionales bacterium]|nr:flagellar hook-associated protein FlgL [Bdellovibrionales bacterium]